jgi:hypothetical protein
VASASIREARALSSSRGWAATGAATGAGAGSGASTRGGGATAGAQLVVLLDQAGELALHHVEEGVDLVLVVTAFADRRLLEDDVVHVGRRQWQRAHLGSDDGDRDVLGRAAANRARPAALPLGSSAITRRD